MDFFDYELIAAEIAAEAAAGAEGDEPPPAATLAEGEEIPF
jgi:hypothetical protein